MLNLVRQHVPNTWADTYSSQKEVLPFSKEFNQVEYELTHACDSNYYINVRRMIRVQDLYSFGQFLNREQLLLNSNDQQLYRVRRFIKVNRLYLDSIIQHNLDPRRCGMGQNLTLLKKLNCVSSHDLIVVVKVLTTQPQSEQITPTSSCDYYVEYVIEQK